MKIIIYQTPIHKKCIILHTYIEDVSKEVGLGRFSSHPRAIPEFLVFL